MDDVTQMLMSDHRRLFDGSIKNSKKENIHTENIEEKQSTVHLEKEREREKKNHPQQV